MWKLQLALIAIVSITIGLLSSFMDGDTIYACMIFSAAFGFYLGLK